MRKLVNFLDRFVGRARVRPAWGEDIGECVGMAFESLRESGVFVSPDARERLEEHFEALIGEEGAAVFIAERGGRVCGMACCAMTATDAWDSRSAASVWFLYVKRGFRKHPGAALGLMRACLSAALRWGAKRVRIVVDEADRRLAERYELVMGFRREVTYGIYSINVEG